MVPTDGFLLDIALIDIYLPYDHAEPWPLYYTGCVEEMESSTICICEWRYAVARHESKTNMEGEDRMF